MKIQSGNNLAAYVSTVGHPARTPSVSARPADRAGRRFDQVSLTAKDSGQSAFQMELTGRISQEVRSATTTGALAELREQVQSGTYQPDPVEIARRILLQREDA